MAYKANFKTGWGQREIHENRKVTAPAKVGYLCSIVGSDTLTPLTSAPVAGTKYAMLAQSDDTLGAGHIPVEHGSYLYSDDVAQSDVVKHVAYFLVDVSDINYKTV